MADIIEAYLAELRLALSGADPAVLQDALYDAEEYLRSAAAEDANTPEAMDRAISAFGTPQEVAAAYLETERTVAVALRRPARKADRNPFLRFFGVIADPTAWGALFYMLLSLATGIVYFTVVVTGLSLSVGLAVLVIGVPVALLFVAVVRAISLAEGRLVEALLGVRMPRRPTIAPSATAGMGILERLKSWFTDYRTWTTMLYMILMLPLGIVYFTILVTALSLSAAIIAAPIFQLVTDMPVAQSWDYYYYLQPWAMPFVMAAGVLGLFVTFWLAKGVGHLHGLFAKTMLVGRFEHTDGYALATTATRPSDQSVTPPAGMPAIQDEGATS